MPWAGLLMLIEPFYPKAGNSCLPWGASELMR